MFDIVALLPRLVGSQAMAARWIEKALGSMAQYYNVPAIAEELYVRSWDEAKELTLLADSTQFWEVAAAYELVD